MGFVDFRSDPVIVAHDSDPYHTKRFIGIADRMKVLAGAEIDLIFHGLVNFAVNHTVSFFRAEGADPAIGFADYTRQSGRIRHDIEVVIEHKT